MHRPRDAKEGMLIPPPTLGTPKTEYIVLPRLMDPKEGARSVPRPTVEMLRDGTRPLPHPVCPNGVIQISLAP